MEMGFETTPLWLAMEEKISELSDADLASGTEAVVQSAAAALDAAGYTVSTHAANMMALRNAVAARQAAGHALLGDLEAAIDGLALTDVEDTLKATVGLATYLGDVWPRMMDFERRGDLHAMVQRKRLDLLVVEASTRDTDHGIRYLLGEHVEHPVIADRLGVSQEQIDRVIAAIKAEAAAVAKVQELLAEVKGKADDVQVRHLIDNGLPEATIIEIGGFGQDVIDAVKAAIAEEKREAERKAAEEAERKKAEAEGPAIEDIPEDELEQHVEAIQEIMEFSEDPDEIRTMCEQSNIPKALIDLAIEDADKLAALIE
jgi:hypothetical protein